jgi:hypothetical protein
MDYELQEDKLIVTKQVEEQVSYTLEELLYQKEAIQQNLANYISTAKNNIAEIDILIGKFNELNK